MRGHDGRRGDAWTAERKGACGGGIAMGMGRWRWCGRGRLSVDETRRRHGGSFRSCDGRINGFAGRSLARRKVEAVRPTSAFRARFAKPHVAETAAGAPPLAGHGHGHGHGRWHEWHDRRPASQRLHMHRSRVEPMGPYMCKHKRKQPRPCQRAWCARTRAVNSVAVLQVPSGMRQGPQNTPWLGAGVVVNGRRAAARISSRVICSFRPHHTSADSADAADAADGHRKD